MIDKINHYSLTTPASIHDEEAITALELSGRLGSKMNEVVEKVNEVDNDTTLWLNKQDEDIAYLRKTQMPNEVKAEVQKNINSGAFNQAIDVYAGNLTAKVNNLVENVPSGSTTMDAEIIDARLDQKTGVAYSSLSKSISGQIEDNTIDYGMPFVKNLYDSSKAIDKMYVSSDGKVYTHNNYVTSEMIRVKGNSVIHFSTLEFYEPMYGETFRRARGGFIVPYLATYDKTGSFIELFQDVEERRYLGANVGYIRFSVERPDLTNVMCSYFNPYSTFMTGDEKIVRPEHIPNYNEISDTILNANLINPKEVIPNAYVTNTNGVVYENPNFFCTGYIPIKYGKPYSLFNRDMNKVDIRMFAVFGRDGVLVTGGEYTDTIELSDYGLEPYFVRLSIANTYMDNCMFAHSDSTVFAEYGEPVLRESALPEIKVKADLETFESHLGGTFKRMTGTSADFPAYLHNFDIMIVGSGSSFTVNVGDTPITTARESDDYHTYIHIKCVEGTATVTKMTTNGETVTTVNNVDSGNISCTGATLISATSRDFSKPLWVIGDSYLGANDDRVYGQLKNLGCGDFLRLSRSGLDSPLAYAELVKALNFGTPKTLVWYVGLNDGSSTVYSENATKVINLCREKCIELILNRTPYIMPVGINHSDAFVRNSGCRYIDSCKAVSPTPSAWRSGTLSSDSVHPTVTGAKMLAMQMVADVPELMTYGGDE